MAIKWINDDVHDKVSAQAHITKFKWLHILLKVLHFRNDILAFADIIRKLYGFDGRNLTFEIREQADECDRNDKQQIQ